MELSIDAPPAESTARPNTTVPEAALDRVAVTDPPTTLDLGSASRTQRRSPIIRFQSTLERDEGVDATSLFDASLLAIHEVVPAPLSPEQLTMTLLRDFDHVLYEVLSSEAFDHFPDAHVKKVLVQTIECPQDIDTADGLRCHMDGGAMAGTVRDRTYIHGLHIFPSDKPCPVRLVSAQGGTGMRPRGVGWLLTTDSRGDLVPYLTFWSPEWEANILAPNSFTKGRDRRHWNGWLIETFEDTQKCILVQKNRLTRRRDIRICGDLRNGLCYTNPVISVDDPLLQDLTNPPVIHGTPSMMRAILRPALSDAIDVTRAMIDARIQQIATSGIAEDVSTGPESPTELIVARTPSHPSIVNLVLDDEDVQGNIDLPALLDRSHCVDTDSVSLCSNDDCDETQCSNCHSHLPSDFVPTYNDSSGVDMDTSRVAIYALKEQAAKILWHQRLGHCSDEYLLDAHKHIDGVLEFKRADGVTDVCPTCAAAKIRKAPRTNATTRRATVPGQGFSIDFGFIGASSKDTSRRSEFEGLNGETCYLLLTDHFTGELFGIPRVSKTVPLDYLMRLLLAHRPANVHDLYVRVDQGGELFCHPGFRSVCRSLGYALEPTGAEASHQNGPVERQHRTIANALRCMLHGANLPNCFWPYAFQHYLRVKNALARRGAEPSITRRTGQREDFSKLRTFGCRVWVKPTGRRRSKLHVHGLKGVFLGYLPRTLKNILWYDVESRRVKIARHARFDEAMNDLPIQALPPNVRQLHRAQTSENIDIEEASADLEPLTFVDLPFTKIRMKTLRPRCEHPTFGFEMNTDATLERAYVCALADGSSALHLCTSPKAARRSYVGAYLVSIDDRPVFSVSDAKDIFADLCRDRRSSFDVEFAVDAPLNMQAIDRAAKEAAEDPLPWLVAGIDEAFDPLTLLSAPVSDPDELLRDSHVLAAIHSLRSGTLPSPVPILQPGSTASNTIVHVHSLQSEAMTDEERALKKLTRRRLMALTTWPLWREAERKQLRQFKQLGMWGKPQRLPPGGILMHPVWQRRVKTCGKRRARYCCDGSPRRAPEVHAHQETYASCVEQPALRLFFALCALENLIVFGGDAQDAFAHSPPPSVPTFISICDEFAEWWQDEFGEQLDRQLVMPIMHALQGHPEAARLWEQHITSILDRIGFKPTTHERNLYRGVFDGQLVLLCRQVDDFALGAPNQSIAESIYAKIGEHLRLPTETVVPFESQGQVSMFNGVDVRQTRDFIEINARSYLRRFLMAHGWETPSNQERSESSRPTEPLSPADVKELYAQSGHLEHTKEHAALERRMGFSYRSVLGELMYAYMIGCLDIGYAITTLAKFSTAPTELHYQRLRGVAKYLRRTIDWGITYWRRVPHPDLPAGLPPEPPIFPDDLPAFPSPLDPLLLHAYVDAAHGNDLRRRRSTTGYCFILAGGAIAYRSKTQSITATSSTEAEFIAAVSAAKVARYLRSVLAELGYEQRDPTPLYEDNASAVKMINASKPTERSRHIDIQNYAIQDWQAAGDIIMHAVPGVVNPADDLTKALGWVLHSRHARRMMGHFRPVWLPNG